MQVLHPRLHSISDSERLAIRTLYSTEESVIDIMILILKYILAHVAFGLNELQQFNNMLKLLITF